MNTPITDAFLELNGYGSAHVLARELEVKLAISRRETQLIAETAERHAKIYETNIVALNATIQTLCGGHNANSKE